MGFNKAERTTVWKYLLGPYSLEQQTGEIRRGKAPLLLITSIKMNVIEINNSSSLHIVLTTHLRMSNEPVVMSKLRKLAFTLRYVV